MIKSIFYVKREHLKIKCILNRIDGFFNEDKINHLNVIKEFEDLKRIWDKHERGEEELLYFFKQFVQKPFPNGTMFIEQHKQFKGHWKVLQDAINSEDLSKLDVALDTDGRMFIRKLREHIDAEDKFFDSFVVRKEDTADSDTEILETYKNL